MFNEGLNSECGLVLENNTIMNRFLEAIGAEKYKTYYSRPLDEE